MQNKRRQNGFTLIEILIVVVIVAILAAIAVPSYRDQVIRSKRSVATAELLEVLSLQEQFFLNNKQYATDLTDLGYSADPYYIGDEGEETSAGSAIYEIDIAACAAPCSFVLEADPKNGQADDTDCGKLTLNSLGARGENGTKDVAACW